MIRRLLSRLLIIFVALLAVWGWLNREHLQAFPGILGGYTAKEYCSCRYVMDNPAEYCVGYAKQYLPLSGFFDDEARKRVTARALGVSQSAQWLGPRQGCQLLPQATALPE
ncbi:amidase [Pseudomonas sp. NPDC078700]|uniref:amidase n=1 Tax=Pseudomonas sp. NPDC078700 TaxID=3364424 RepID=UPI0037C58CDE